jgi:hypothetical protein
VVTNKSFKDKTTANIKIKGGEYSYVHLYGLNNIAPQVFNMKDNTENKSVQVMDNTITYEMEPETVSLLLIAKDKDCIPDFSAGISDKTENSDAEKEGKKASKNNKGVIAAVIGAAALCGAGFWVFRAKKKNKT